MYTESGRKRTILFVRSSNKYTKLNTHSALVNQFTKAESTKKGMTKRVKEQEVCPIVHTTNITKY